MKKLILSELLLLFLATTFISDNPNPGWVQQTLPVNDQINDIFFLDSLTGWVVTNSNLNPPDSGYILKTTDRGNSWLIQFKDIIRFNVVQFINQNTGYAGAEDPTAKVYKSTNGGSNWFVISSALTGLSDLFFINKDTGWYCYPNDFGGIFKTTNGGTNWIQQMSGNNFPQKLFFINSDTGWAGSSDWKLYRTTNSGQTWELQYTFSAGLAQIFFTSKDTGFVSGGFGTHSVKRTTNSGFSWDSTVNSQGGRGLFFINRKIGWNSDIFSIVQKTTDGGLSWFRQTVPSGYYYSIQFADSNNGWSGGTILIHTSDGGGPPAGIIKIGNDIPSDYELYQNYPNPFNPITNIKYQISKSGHIILKIYNIQGKEVYTLVNQKQHEGIYEADFDGTSYSSGVYFYSLIVDGQVIDTKKMVFLK
jgi:photosystem II stability/assembly factor-like uncharacterized protein